MVGRTDQRERRSQLSVKELQMKFVLAGLALGIVGALAPTPATAQAQPVSLSGKCAKALGASYDPARGGWFTRPNQGAQWRKCVGANGKGFFR